MEKHPKKHSLSRLKKNIAKMVRDGRWLFLKFQLRRKFQNPLLPDKFPEKPLLFFMPEAGVELLYLRTAFAVKTLQQLGHEVLVVRCFDLYRQCVIKASSSASGHKKSTSDDACLRCGDYASRVLDYYGLQSIDLRCFLTPEIKHAVEEQIENLPEDLLTYEYEGIQWGKLAVSNIAVRRKVSNLDTVQQSYRQLWREHIREDLQTFLLARQLMKAIEVKSWIYFCNYSMHRATKIAAVRENIPVYWLTWPGHKDVDFQRFTVYREPALHSQYDVRNIWPQWRDVPLSSDRICEISDDLIGRLTGSGTYGYSPAKTRGGAAAVLEQLGLEAGKKVIVAYTSSLDELLGVKLAHEAQQDDLPLDVQPFDHQIDWLSRLVDHCKNRDDLQLVVRVHPRESKNQRDSVISDHLGRLRQRFGGVDGDCRFVWPEESISSYDLAEAANLVLTSWSTIGLELARLGIPVLAAFNSWYVPYPVDDFMEWASSDREYFQKLDQLLSGDCTLNRIARAFRWYNLVNLETAVDFKDVVPPGGDRRFIPFKMSSQARVLENAVVGGEPLWEIHLRERLGSASETIAVEEKSSLQRNLRRIIHYILTGDPTTTADASMGSLAIDGSYVEFQIDGQRRRRFSPLIVRLATLCDVPIEQKNSRVA